MTSRVAYRGLPCGYRLADRSLECDARRRGWRDGLRVRTTWRANRKNRKRGAWLGPNPRHELVELRARARRPAAEGREDHEAGVRREVGWTLAQTCEAFVHGGPGPRDLPMELLERTLAIGRPQGLARHPVLPTVPERRAGDAHRRSRELGGGVWISHVCVARDGRPYAWLRSSPGNDATSSPPEPEVAQPWKSLTSGVLNCAITTRSPEEVPQKYHSGATKVQWAGHQRPAVVPLLRRRLRRRRARGPPASPASSRRPGRSRARRRARYDIHEPSPRSAARGGLRLLCQNGAQVRGAARRGFRYRSSAAEDPPLVPRRHVVRPL